MEVSVNYTFHLTLLCLDGNNNNKNINRRRCDVNSSLTVSYVSSPIVCEIYGIGDSVYFYNLSRSEINQLFYLMVALSLEIQTIITIIIT